MSNVFPDAKHLSSVLFMYFFHAPYLCFWCDFSDPGTNWAIVNLVCMKRLFCCLSHSNLEVVKEIPFINTWIWASCSKERKD